jgi:hypothetical protein
MHTSYLSTLVMSTMSISAHVRCIEVELVQDKRKQALIDNCLGNDQRRFILFESISLLSIWARLRDVHYLASMHVNILDSSVDIHPLVKTR